MLELSVWFILEVWMSSKWSCIIFLACEHQVQFICILLLFIGGVGQHSLNLLPIWGVELQMVHPRTILRNLWSFCLYSKRKLGYRYLWVGINVRIEVWVVCSRKRRILVWALRWQLTTFHLNQLVKLRKTGRWSIADLDRAVLHILAPNVLNIHGLHDGKLVWIVVQLSRLIVVQFGKLIHSIVILLSQ